MNLKLKLHAWIYRRFGVYTEYAKMKEQEIKMKPRADKFKYAAEREDLMTIQGEVQRHKTYIENDKTLSDIEKGNKIIFLYTAVAFDEGYRKAIKNLKEDMSGYSSKTIKLKNHRKNWLEYTGSDEVTALTPLIKRRINSKRMRKNYQEMCKDENRKFEEETFMLAMALHTGFEHGFMKESTIEETAKWVAKDQERADLLVKLMSEFLPEDVMND